MQIRFARLGRIGASIADRRLAAKAMAGGRCAATGGSASGRSGGDRGRWGDANRPESGLVRGGAAGDLPFLS